MDYRITITVNAPIEKTFSLVDDAEKLKLWMDGLMDTEYTSPFDPANPLGTTFRQKIKEGGRVTEYEGEVTGYDKPHRLAVRIGNRHFDSHVDYRFTAEGQATRLDYTCTVTLHTLLAKMMGVCFSWMTGRIVNKQLTRLKAVAEADG